MSDDFKLQVSFKTPGGTLVNVRANSPEELQALLIGTDGLATDVVAHEQKYSAVHNLAPLSTGPSTATPLAQDFSSQGFPSTPPVVAQPANAQGPTCMHGARKYLTGSKNGKTWAGWMCPTPKDAPDKCSPVWA